MASLEADTSAARLRSFPLLPGRDPCPAPMRDAHGRPLPAEQREGQAPGAAPSQSYAEAEPGRTLDPGFASSRHAVPALPEPLGASADARTPSNPSVGPHTPGSNKEPASVHQGLAPRRPPGAGRSLSVSGRERAWGARGSLGSSSGKGQHGRCSLGSEREFEQLSQIREAPGHQHPALATSTATAPAHDDRDGEDERPAAGPGTGLWHPTSGVSANGGPAGHRGSALLQAHLQALEMGGAASGTPEEEGAGSRDPAEGVDGAPGEHRRSSSVPRGFMSRAKTVSESWGAGVRLLGERLSPGAPGARPCLRTPSPVHKSPVAALRSRSVGRESHSSTERQAGTGGQAAGQRQASAARELAPAGSREGGPGGRPKTTKVGDRFWGGRLVWDIPGARQEGGGEGVKGARGLAGPTVGRGGVGGRGEANGQAGGGAAPNRAASGGRGRSTSPLLPRWASFKPTFSGQLLPHAPAQYEAAAASTPLAASESAQAQAAYGAASIPGALGNARASEGGEGDTGNTWASMRRSRSMTEREEDESGRGPRDGRARGNGELRSERKGARRGGEAGAGGGAGGEHGSDSPRTMTQLSPYFLARLFSGSATWGSFHERSLWGSAKPDTESPQHSTRPPHGSSGTKKGAGGNPRKRNLDFQGKAHGSSTGHTAARPAARSAARGHASSRAAESAHGAHSSRGAHSTHSPRSAQSPNPLTPSRSAAARQSAHAPLPAHSSTGSGGTAPSGVGGASAASGGAPPGSGGIPGGVSQARSHSMTPERDGLRIQSLTKARSLRLQSNDAEGWAAASASPHTPQGPLGYPRHTHTPGDPARAGRERGHSARGTPQASHSPSGQGRGIFGGGPGRAKHLRSGSMDWVQAWSRGLGVEISTPQPYGHMGTPPSGGGSRRGRREGQGAREGESGVQHARSGEHPGAPRGKERAAVRAGSEKERPAARGLGSSAGSGPGTPGAAAGRAPAWNEGVPSTILPEDGDCSLEDTSGTPAEGPPAPARRATVSGEKAGAGERAAGSERAAHKEALLSRNATVGAERAVHERLHRPGKEWKGPLDSKYVKRRTRSEVGLPKAATLDLSGRSAAAAAHSLERSYTSVARRGSSAQTGKGPRREGAHGGAKKEGANTGGGSSERAKPGHAGSRKEGNGSRRADASRRDGGSTRGGDASETATAKAAKQGTVAGAPSHRHNYSIDSVKSLFTLQGITRSFSVRHQGRGKSLLAEPLPASRASSRVPGGGAPAAHSRGGGGRDEEQDSLTSRHRRATSLESLAAGAILDAPQMDLAGAGEGPCHACGRHSPRMTPSPGLPAAPSPVVGMETAAVPVCADNVSASPQSVAGGQGPLVRQMRAGTLSAGRQRVLGAQRASGNGAWTEARGDLVGGGSAEDALRPLPILQDRQRWPLGVPEGVRGPLRPGRALAKAQSWQERPRYSQGQEAERPAQVQGHRLGQGQGQGYAMGGEGVTGRPPPGTVTSIYVTIRQPPRPVVPRLSVRDEPDEGAAALRFHSPQGTPGVPRFLSPGSGSSTRQHLEPPDAPTGAYTRSPIGSAGEGPGAGVDSDRSPCAGPSLPGQRVARAPLALPGVPGSETWQQSPSPVEVPVKPGLPPSVPPPGAPPAHAAQQPASQEAARGRACAPPAASPGVPSPRYRSPAMRHRILRSASVGSSERRAAAKGAGERQRPGLAAGVPPGALVDAAAAVTFFGRNPFPPPSAGSRAPAAEKGDLVVPLRVLPKGALDTAVAGSGVSTGEGSPAGAALGSILEGFEGEGTGEGTVRPRRAASVPRLRYPGNTIEEVEAEPEASTLLAAGATRQATGTGQPLGAGAGARAPEASVSPVPEQQTGAADEDMGTPAASGATSASGVPSASGIASPSGEATANGVPAAGEVDSIRSFGCGADVSGAPGEGGHRRCEQGKGNTRDQGEREEVGSGGGQRPADTRAPTFRALFPRDISLDEGIAEGTGSDSDGEKEVTESPPGEGQALSVSSVESQSSGEGEVDKRGAVETETHPGSPGAIDTPRAAQAAPGGPPALNPLAPGPSVGSPNSPRRLENGRCLTRFREPVREHRLPPRHPGAQARTEAATDFRTPAVSLAGPEMGALALALTPPLASVPGGVDLDSGFVNVTGQASWNS